MYAIRSYYGGTRRSIIERDAGAQRVHAVAEGGREVRAVARALDVVRVPEALDFIGGSRGGEADALTRNAVGVDALAPDG